MFYIDINEIKKLWDIMKNTNYNVEEEVLKQSHSVQMSTLVNTVYDPYTHPQTVGGETKQPVYIKQLRKFFDKLLQGIVQNNFFL